MKPTDTSAAKDTNTEVSKQAEQDANQKAHWTHFIEYKCDWCGKIETIPDEGVYKRKDCCHHIMSLTFKNKFSTSFQ